MRSILRLMPSLCSEMKKSRFKIWLRAFLFVQFSALFSIYFFRDVADGYFRWEWIPIVFALFVPVGFWLSRLVPLQADLEMRAVTISLDRIYLMLIGVLVIAKLIMGRIPSLVYLADIIMCSILGIMFGRLGGIGMRVRHLKLRYGLAQK